MRLTRLLAIVALLYLGGFAIFATSLGRPLGDRRTDAVVVPTGGPGRIPRGLELIRHGQAKRMLISGTAPDVRPIELAVANNVPARLFSCCVDLGHDAVDTRGNADETAAWVRRHGFRTVRLVTADSHMPRARLELTSALGSGVTVVGDGVPTAPSFATLVAEYNKYLLRAGALGVGVGQ